MSEQFALEGLPVRDGAGRPVGELERLLLDADTGKPNAIVVRDEDGGARVVPAAQLAVTEDGMILHTREGGL